MSSVLNTLTAEELGQLFPVIIKDYDQEWAGLFTTEKEAIIKTIDSQIISGLEHIGSTSVPGLCAKPTIDILLEIHKNADIRLLTGNLESIGYDHIPKPENPAPHMMFAKGYSVNGITGQTYHIHVRYPGDWDEIVFRDFLKEHPEVAREYSDLKKKMAAEFRNDREKYTDSKSDFIRNTVLKARRKQ